MSRVQAIVTVPPHADFLEEVARHPVVGGLRLNTVMPIKGSPRSVLGRLSALGQPLWIDLKGRQLRIAQAAVPPFTEVRLSHRISVDTPARALFKNGAEEVRVMEVDGDRLILEDGPRCVLGPGESVNIPCSSLRIEGILTERDREYLEAAQSLGLRNLMLSFVESTADVEAVHDLYPEANVVAKIESRRGLGYVEQQGNKQARLMAARGDLYLELSRPHHMLSALRTIVRADPEAIVASRIFDSLAWEPEPACQDVTDAACLILMGYRHLMLGDEVCLRRDTVLPALDLLQHVVRDLAPTLSARPRTLAQASRSPLSA